MFQTAFCAAGTRGQRIRRRAAHGDEDPRPARLPKRLIDFRSGRRFQGKVPDVSDHAHYFESLVLGTKFRDHLADRILTGKNSRLPWLRLPR